MYAWVVWATLDNKPAGSKRGDSMANLTSPTASAECGLPNVNDMADVIDSLKRLERVGSENSKTTEKLLAAAGALSSLIAQQFRPADGDDILAATMDETSEGFSLRTNYRVRGGKSTDLDRLYRDRVYVALNRDVALAFSKDIANGLLDRIIETLAERIPESQAGIDALTIATANLEPK